MLTILTLTKAQRIGYWGLLALFSAGILWSSYAYLTEAPKMVAEITRLGYPVYFMKILGAAKITGIIALIVTRSPVVKEWAYAGFTIDLICAALSHIALEDPVLKVVTPLLFLAVLGGCYKLEHPNHHLVPSRTKKVL